MEYGTTTSTTVVLPVEYVLMEKAPLPHYLLRRPNRLVVVEVVVVVAVVVIDLVKVKLPFVQSDLV